MAIEVISTLKPKNNGDFPIAEAKDISVDDNGTRLVDKLAAVLMGVTTAAEMDAILASATSANVGAMYMYIGETTEKYENGAIYRIEVG